MQSIGRIVSWPWVWFIAIVAGVVLAAPPPALAAASVTLSIASGAPGTSGTINGANFFALQPLTVFLDVDPAGTVLNSSCGTNSTGNVKSGCAFIIPPSASIGQHSIIVDDGQGNHPSASFIATAPEVTPTATATPSVTPTTTDTPLPTNTPATPTTTDTPLATSTPTATHASASISVSTASGPVGTSGTISGANFSAVQPLTIYFDVDRLGLVLNSSCGTDSAGDVKSGCIFTIPGSASIGQHNIIADDGQSNHPSASFDVTVPTSTSTATSTATPTATDLPTSTATPTATDLPTSTATP
ncbi:MAG TPA: hypothetical protein VK457_09685, partial [Chloroflexota bacterium]|nr:hypothetical protein [Chloroflexota bacterium]